MRIRTLLTVTGVLALSAAALGVGIAVGARSVHRDSAPPKAALGAIPRSTPKPTLPKAQAYAYFAGGGTMYGPSKKVVAVHHVSAGFYCVELATSIHVSGTTFANASVDYANTINTLAVAMQYSNDSYCSVTVGYPNSVGIVTVANDTGTAVLTDEPVFFTVP